MNVVAGVNKYPKNTKGIASSSSIILNIYPLTSLGGKIQNGQEPMFGSSFLFL
ncbi:uncharacterized protein METZ01_LOCUS211215 [marine metagenome]|uniref:Uncharacterized protein n=1 Tax=marine metagenome TaxID=408172 RepID=A0A382F8E2_9ZZZZ